MATFSKNELEQLSITELKALRKRVSDEFDRREREVVVKKIEQLAAHHGMTLSQIFPRLADARPGRKPVDDAETPPVALKGRVLPPKYQHPEEPNLTWAGKGTKPAWVRAWLENGGALEGLAVTA